jgi:tRNA(Ile)-lysidine synthase
MDQFESHMMGYLQRYQLAAPGQSIILAVSGGVDSMAMMHLFSRIRDRMNLHLSVLHINHQLRGEESMGDELFVQSKSAEYGMPFYCERVDVKSYARTYGLSKQLAARRLRYESFERWRTCTGANAVATAHHADDNAETVLLNILRGTGIHGLAGIPVKHETGDIIRPLLFARRKDIEAYALRQSIVFRNDSSNQMTIYRRNELRHIILPALQRQHPGIMQTLNTIASHMQQVHVSLRTMIEQAMKNIVQLDQQGQLLLKLNRLKSEPEFLWDEIFVEILRRLDIEPTEKKVEALHRLCDLPTGRRVELSGRYSAYRDRNTILFGEIHEEQPAVQQVEFGNIYDYQTCHISIGIPEQTPPAFTGTHGVEYVDAGQLGKQLLLRPWRPGDWFIPFGMNRKKKVSDFFTDQKIPRFQKSSIPVLESDGRIVWICGKRIDDRFKLTDRTHTAIRLTCQPLARVTHG